MKRAFSAWMVGLLCLAIQASSVIAKDRQYQVAGVQVRSFYDLSDKDQARLKRFLDSTGDWAKAFAAESKHKQIRAGPISVIEFCGGSRELSVRIGLPRFHLGREVIGRADPANARILMAKHMDLETTAHELGHWYFGDSETTADAFMNFVMEKWKAAEAAREAAEKAPKERK